MTEIKTRGRMRANKLFAGLLIRKPKPYRGYEICEWTRIARIERRGSDVVFYGVDGKAIDGCEVKGEIRPGRWSANAAFEIGQLADDDAEQAARSFAASPQARGWHYPAEVA